MEGGGARRQRRTRENLPADQAHEVRTWAAATVEERLGGAGAALHRRPRPEDGRGRGARDGGAPLVGLRRAGRAQAARAAARARQDPAGARGVHHAGGYLPAEERHGGQAGAPPRRGRRDATQRRRGDHLVQDLLAAHQAAAARARLLLLPLRRDGRARRLRAAPRVCRRACGHDPHSPGGEDAQGRVCGAAVHHGVQRRQ
mmetsp:Transcript_17388/g.41667  ORF Transcript_17388/g.41667 Transcript_17388/m.41667 type:complete len:201 (-) Transcript_17388:3204-3806(-)